MWYFTVAITPLPSVQREVMAPGGSKDKCCGRVGNLQRIADNHSSAYSVRAMRYVIQKTAIVHRKRRTPRGSFYTTDEQTSLRDEKRRTRQKKKKKIHSETLTKQFAFHSSQDNTHISGEQMFSRFFFVLFCLRSD